MIPNIQTNQPCVKSGLLSFRSKIKECRLLDGPPLRLRMPMSTAQRIGVTFALAFVGTGGYLFLSGFGDCCGYGNVQQFVISSFMMIYGLFWLRADYLKLSRQAHRPTA
jgi:hypothetical protein